LFRGLVGSEMCIRDSFWAAQELDFYAREKSQSLADLVVSTD
jgi:hypothetical protein